MVCNRELSGFTLDRPFMRRASTKETRANIIIIYRWIFELKSYLSIFWEVSLRKQIYQNSFYLFYPQTVYYYKRRI